MLKIETSDIKLMEDVGNLLRCVRGEERENEELKMIVRDMIVNRVGESGDFSSLKDFLIGSCCSRFGNESPKNTPSNAGWKT